MITLNRQLYLSLLLICVLCLMTPHVNAAKRAPWVGKSLSNNPCRGGSQGYGPYDYTLRGSLWRELKRVEDYHFTAPVRNLIRGQSSTDITADIDYTLRAWPNHHHALNSLSRYHIRRQSSLKKSYRPQTGTPTECYFQRAINFSPEDATTRMLFSMHLHKSKHLKLANEQYAEAIKLSPKNPIIRYNYGLLLVDLKKYDLAQQQAIIAYDANFPLNGLKNKLIKVKHWPPKPSVKLDSKKANKTNAPSPQ